ncbi:hypothetical protein QQG74_30435 [Micromonospora sp. FIMYZ51]|uniref:hypothetical protein n=1 Tax=Micromonospora sp. FIMYZ51 TaxID=3051832 RepID=UPI00311D8B98
MSKDYYGWQPTPYPHYAGISDDYAADRAARSRPYQPTAWDGVDIEQMHEYVTKEDDGRTATLAETWSRAADLLRVTRENLKRHADALDAKWDSPAGRVFMSKIGATLHSLDEWQRVAANNASGLSQLADKISTAQRDMRELYRQYEAEQRKQRQAYEDDKAKITFSDLFGDKHKTPEEVRQEFHQRAKNIAKPLADFYIDVYISKISRGGKFKGPTEADPLKGGSGDRPGGSGGGPGARSGSSVVGGPSGGVERPDLPPRPELPGRPDLIVRPTEPTPVTPGVPEGPGLAGGTVTPVPTPTPPPVTTPNPPVTPGPAPPPPVVTPGPRPMPPGPRPIPPGPPNTGPRPMPPGPPNTGPRPTLPGSGGGSTTTPGSRPPLPNRPTLPGAGGSGNPGMVPGGGQRGPVPNRATLPGNTGAPGPRSSAPVRPTTPPPSLGGPRGAAPGTPRPATPPLAGRSQPPPAARPPPPGCVPT